MIVNNINNLQDIECYSYCDDGKGNIEILFKQSDDSQYKLVILEKDLKTMSRLCKVGKLL